jgi:hypothetical protein
MGIIRDTFSNWMLRKRLPFYVQLAQACPEDIDDPSPHTVLTSISEMRRSISDFLLFKHPVKRSERRNFVGAFMGTREIQTSHEKSFLNWRQRCWHNDYYSSELYSPPYKNLFSSSLRIRGGDAQYRLLDEENEKFLADNVLSNDDLTWFENAYGEGDEYAENARLDDYWAERVRRYREDLPPTYTVTDAVADGALVNYPGYAPHDSDYSPDGYGEDEYEINAEQHLDDFGAEEPNLDYKDG